MPRELDAPELEPNYSLDRDPEARETVRRVAAEVLETMFFTEAEEAPCDHIWLEIACCARIHFEGSHFGEMLLGVSVEATDPIAASFLGIETEELTDALRGQMVQELANILCGAMLSRLWPESTLALSSPELSGWLAWPAGGTLHCCFATPEGRLAISIRLSQPLAG
jgi:CheY-specific phosphatase CheX